MNPLIGDRITLVKGDITGIRADAIVNAANSSLLGGGGVDGRIHQVAGAELLEECRGLGGCEPGSAKITHGYRLPARHVIHAVGPIYRDGKSGEPQLLAGCYRTALQLAAENGCTSIAFPAISCGAYGYPLIEAAKVAFAEVVQGLRRYPDLRVYFVLYDQRSYDVYRQIHQAVLNTPAESRP